MSWDKERYVGVALKNLQNDELNELKKDIDNIDLNRVKKIFTRCTQPQDDNNGENVFEPLDTILKASGKEQEAEWESRGLAHIGLNKVAVVLLAGGQGSRLGYDHPKGMFDFGLPSHKSLFQIQAERIINLKTRAPSKDPTKEISIPWYIMTSDATYTETVEFFENNNYFGLDENDVIFFKQNKLPATDQEGNILLVSPSSVSIFILFYI